MVQTRFPIRKHIPVFANAASEMDAIEVKTSETDDVSIPENLVAEHRKMYAVMGSQNVGTTYHSVRVCICIIRT